MPVPRTPRPCGSRPAERRSAGSSRTPAPAVWPDLLGHDPAGADTLAIDGKSARGSRLGSTPAAHLLGRSERPDGTVQVLPFSRGAHASMFGPYVVLGFPEAGALDVVLADNPTGSTWLEREVEVARYRDLFDAARTSALSPVESRAVIQRRAKEYGP